MILSKREYEFLLSIVKNNRCFDRRDNTFKQSNRRVATLLDVSPSKVDRLFRKLKQNDLVREVKPTFQSERLMLSPKFLFDSFIKSDRWIIGALYHLRDINLVYEWARLCRQVNGFIDYETGELLKFNWYYIDQKSSLYSSYDRCYRPMTKRGVIIDDDNHKEQHYCLSELRTELSGGLVKYDFDWFKKINSLSPHEYRNTWKNTNEYLTPVNIRKVEINID